VVRREGGERALWVVCWLRLRRSRLGLWCDHVVVRCSSSLSVDDTHVHVHHAVEEPQSHAQKSPFGEHTPPLCPLLRSDVPLKNPSNAPFWPVLPFSPQSKSFPRRSRLARSPHAFLAHSAAHDITVHVLTIPRPSWASESMLGDM
jgi:hypothetical protein